VAQGYPIESATHLAVFIHGSAGDFLAKKNGPIGYLATDVMKELPNQIRDIAVGI
jgi:NAD(P)H-hydrate repair Nnr-like enzyme with NAD(P)H-hydrate dehydratase domain